MLLASMYVLLLGYGYNSSSTLVLECLVLVEVSTSLELVIGLLDSGY